MVSLRITGTTKTIPRPAILTITYRREQMQTISPDFPKNTDNFLLGFRLPGHLLRSRAYQPYGCGNVVLDGHALPAKIPNGD